MPDSRNNETTGFRIRDCAEIIVVLVVEKDKIEKIMLSRASKE